jgi:hypothetical protein
MQACAMQADLTLIPSTCMGVCVCGGGGGGGGGGRPPPSQHAATAGRVLMGCLYVQMGQQAFQTVGLSQGCAKTMGAAAGLLCERWFVR